MSTINHTLRLLCVLLVCFTAGGLSGCKAIAPKLPEMQAAAPMRTTYSNALGDLNTILEAYLPPEYPETFYYVKPIIDATGLSQTGEIPLDITALVRDAVAQVYHKVRYVEQYDQTDIVQIQAELLKLQTNKLQGIAALPAQRPAVDFTITGRISQFDRNLESQSDKSRAMANFGAGTGRTDANAEAEQSSRLSRLSISFSVFNPNGVSIPGKFGASMEVMYAKNGIDIGFAVFGNGLGYGSEATAMHGRHLALQMMTEFSVVQMIGRTLNIPYWRVGDEHRIFEPDPLVLDEWRRQYSGMGSMLIPFMQAQCIACGDTSVTVTGILDGPTRAALDRFADKFDVGNRQYPNFEIYRELEENRLLDRNAAARAWNAYNAYKAGVRPIAPVVAPDKAPQPKPAAAPAAPARKQPAASGRPAPRPRPAEDVTAPLEDLL